jgi:hypothetical protein
VLAIEEKNARLRRDRYPDFVGHLQAATAFKLLLRQEDANELSQFCLFIG